MSTRQGHRRQRLRVCCWKWNKRLLALCLLLAVCLTGCGEKKQASQEREALTLSIHMHYWGEVAFHDDWPVFKKAEELTGIRLKGDVSLTAADSGQVFNIMLESGKLSDIVHLEKQNANKYGAEGIFIPLNDLIDQYAPNIKAFFEEDPRARQHMTSPDGNIYYISFISEGETGRGYFIRKDWLDRLGLPVPEDFDAYYDAMLQFKNKDPNGNGEADEIPLFFRGGGDEGSISSLLGVRGGIVFKNGKAAYPKATNEYRRCLQTLQKWYGQGLIDPQLYTRGFNARDELLKSDRGGATHDWFASTASYNDILKDSLPGFEMIAIKPPMEKGRPPVEPDPRVTYTNTGWSISKYNQHPIEAIKYFDFWFSEEGRRLMNYGIEGEQYEMVDGKPKFKPEILNASIPVLEILKGIGAQTEIGFRQDYDYEKQWMNQYALDGIRMYVDNGYIVKNDFNYNFTLEEQKIIEEREGYITNYIDRMSRMFIMGELSVDAEFDNYLNQLRAMGVQKVLDAYQQAYDRQIRQGGNS